MKPSKFDSADLDDPMSSRFMGDTMTPTDAQMKPGDVLEWSDGNSESHRWRIKGVHLGAVGTESLIELENVSHKPGWTGEWETHVMMFVPECLLRNCKVVR